MKSGMELNAFVAEIRRQSQARVDMLAAPELLHFGTRGGGGNAEGVLHVTTGDINARTVKEYPMNKHALRQMAEVFHVPQKYVELMRSEQPNLLAENMNTWLRSRYGMGAQHSQLIRVLDNRVRAFLSPRYKIVDNRMLMEYIMPELATMGLEVDFHTLDLSERSLYIKAVSNKLTTDVQEGDAVQCGVVITNSEVGYRRLSVYPMLYRLICKNGLIMPEQGMARNHIGRMLSQDDLVGNLLSDEAIEADNRALMLKVRDTVKHSMTEATFKQMADKMRKTLGIEITGNPVQAVQVLSNQYSLTLEEHDGVLEQMMRASSMTAFGLINAVTAFAQTVTDSDRSIELEEVGGKLLSLDRNGWRPIVEARQVSKQPELKALTA